MKEEFAVGQRWFSHAEAELGLGVVTDIAARRVEVFFPAIEEKRLYAENNAPLSRIVYPVGDQVTDQDGLTIRVTGHETISDCIVYLGLDESGAEQLIHESSLESRVHFSKPYERLFAGQIDKLKHYELRLETLELQHQHQNSPAYGLLGPRVQCLPHQFYIAQEVGKRIAPRVLLADEVGLGKTIEAGLIIHQQLTCGYAGRVLIVVPDSLVYQWLVEMLRRFNLKFSIFDSERCRAEQGNPFLSEQLVLVPLSLLTRDAEALQYAEEAGWDLLVVDEAHHLGWSEEAASHAYLCIEQLARQIRGLLLLTATPEQLGIASHFSRLRLLDPDRYPDLQRFIDEEKSYLQVSQLIEKIQHEDARDQLLQDEGFITELRSFLVGDEVTALLQAWQTGDDNAAALQIDRVIRQLLDQHGTGRVLFRNTRDNVQGFPERSLQAHPLPMPDCYPALLEQVAPEQSLHPELLYPEHWLAEDSRADWLVKWLQTHRTEKVLLICAHASTAIGLEKQLRLYQGVRTALFHEGMSLLERDRAAAYFAEADQGAQVLLCSEIGSEGRNFQFAHHLIMFDLPLNPDLLEQRIGRLDRIGQRDNVIIHVPYFTDSAQEVLLRWYDEGLNAFERVCPDGQVLLQRFASELMLCLQEPEDMLAVETLLEQTQNAHETLRQELQQGRDRLLELNSCDLVQAEALLTDVENASQPAGLSGYMTRVVDHFGVDRESYGSNGMVLHPGDHMLCHYFPGLPEDGVSVTFQRNEALAREDLQFLTLEHPMVVGAMEMMLQGGYGSATLCTLKLPPLKEGSLLVEGVFRLHCSAERRLQLQRYLPASGVRLVLDETGNDLSEVITAQHFQVLAKPMGRQLGLKVSKAARSGIAELANKMELQVQQQQVALLAEAREKAKAELQPELDRLRRLAKINPNIRDQEIHDLAELQQQVLQSLERASLEMDAIRVALVTHQ